MKRESSTNLRVVIVISAILLIIDAYLQYYKMEEVNYYAYFVELIPCILLCCIIALLIASIHQMQKKEEVMMDALKQKNSQLSTMSFQEYKAINSKDRKPIYGRNIGLSLLSQSEDEQLKPLGLIVFTVTDLTKERKHFLFAIMKDSMVLCHMEQNLYLFICYHSTEVELQRLLEQLKNNQIECRSSFVKEEMPVLESYERITETWNEGAL